MCAFSTSSATAADVFYLNIRFDGSAQHYKKRYDRALDFDNVDATFCLCIEMLITYVLG